LVMGMEGAGLRERPEPGQAAMKPASLIGHILLI
jgi:hypothetical protein